jgi:GntR family transcriptional regulator
MLIQLDYRDGTPIYEQIVNRIKKLVLIGAMAPDEPLPSVRSLAVELATNPNTVQKAYAELERQGVIYTVKGRGNFISGDKSLVEVKKKEMREQLMALMKEADELGIDRKELLKGLE